MYYPVFLYLEIVLHIFCYHQAGVICPLMPVLTLPCRLLLLVQYYSLTISMIGIPSLRKSMSIDSLETGSASEPKKATCYQESSISQKAEDLPGRISFLL